MTPKDFSVAFHIGAHKTATTHLQRSLDKASEGLKAVGVRYYGPNYFRLPGRSISALFGLKENADPSKAKRSPQDQLTLMRKDAHRLVFSEENFIGVLNSPRRFPVTVRYPDADARITALAQALGRPVDVLIGIRRPTSFINSAYCQMLMGGRVMPLEKFKQINPISSVDWLDLVQRLQKAEGVANLTVWRQEDYAGVFPKICTSLVGAEHAAGVIPLPRRIHEGLSAEAVAETLRRHAVGNTEKLGFSMRKMLPIGAEHPGFDGFDTAEHQSGDAAYAVQVSAIAQMPDVTLLRLDPD